MAVCPWAWPAQLCGVVCSMHHDPQWLYIVPLSLQPFRCVYTACTLSAGLGGRDQGGPSVHAQPVVLPFLAVEDVIDQRLCPCLTKVLLLWSGPWKPGT